MDDIEAIRRAGPLSAALERRLWRPGAAAVALILLLWAPVLGLGALSGTAPWRDPTLHARLLVAVPLLLSLERRVPRALAAVVASLGRLPLIRDAARARFDAAVARLARGLDAGAVDAALLGLTVVSVVAALLVRPSTGSTAWGGAGGGGDPRLDAAGWWALLVCGPVFLFLVLRTAWRALAWTLFLWRLSRLDLALEPTHPDRAGGLGVLAIGQASFIPAAMAASVLAAGVLAGEVLAGPVEVWRMQLDVVGFTLAAVGITVAPLTLFAPALLRAKRRGLVRHGALAFGLSRAFEGRWIDAEGAPQASLLGSPDPSAMADYAATYDVVAEMRLVPLSRGTLLRITVLVLAPFLLLVPLQYPPQEIVRRVLDALG